MARVDTRPPYSVSMRPPVFDRRSELPLSPTNSPTVPWTVRALDAVWVEAEAVAAAVALGWARDEVAVAVAAVVMVEGTLARGCGPRREPRCGYACCWAWALKEPAGAAAAAVVPATAAAPSCANRAWRDSNPWVV